MIIKSSKYRRRRFRKLAEYILSDKGRAKDDNILTIYHNLHSANLDGIVKEFQENDQYRRKRKNGVVLFHEIIGFHVENSDDLSPEILEKVARYFIHLRGENALCLAKVHVHENHIHIHFMFSANEVRSSKGLRLDNKQFRQIRLDMEEFQIENFPQLEQSIVYLNKWQKDRLVEKDTSKTTDKEFQLKKRIGKGSQKDRVSQLVQECFSASSSRDDFFRRIIDHGISLYRYRNNKVNGVLFGGRKYRFRTLSISDRQMELLSKNASRIDELERIMKQKEQSRSKDFGLDR